MGNFVAHAFLFNNRQPEKHFALPLHLHTPPKKSLWIFWRLPRRYFITARNDGKGFRQPESI
ncbi:MAG: hypothetical protein IJ187_05655 [Neisseriaceae bacterium]|nr:hypothetical protein [Neisseriaceae bacterium]